MANPAGTARDGTSALASPPLVAVAGWVLPGAGYWLIGQRARGVVVGATILALFLVGVLIGGIRAIQVPGYGENGGKLFVRSVQDQRSRTVYTSVEEQTTERPNPQGVWVATSLRPLLRDVGNKPWSICQVLTGPVALAGGAWSVAASRPDDRGRTAGVLSHSRVNEIAVLYTAVAGMLNLLVIIDAAARAAAGGQGAADSLGDGTRAPFTSSAGAA